MAMKDLERSIAQLQAHLVDAPLSSPSVSSVPVAWHIEHALMVIQKITASVARSDPGDYRRRFHWARALLFALGRMPRGRGKAPDAVRPAPAGTPDWTSLFDGARSAVRLLETVHPDRFFVHPALGVLNRKDTFTLLDIHSRHHLAIIRDILASHRQDPAIPHRAGKFPDTARENQVKT